MKLYAIKLSDENLYVTQRGGLDELGSRTQFFHKPELAERCLVKVKDGVKLPSLLVHEIVWKRLEKKYDDFRWNLNISYKEFGDVQDSLEFEIVEIELNEKKTVKCLRQKRYRAKKTN